MGLSPTGLKGVAAKIEYSNPDLCVQGGQEDYSWSLSWVGIVGPGVGDIYQGGIAKCQFVPAFAGHSCPYNSGISYFWYYWGYGDGACGMHADSGFRKALKGNAPQGSDPYGNVHRIEYNSVTSRFVYSIDGVNQKLLDASIPLTCWAGGIRGAQLMNEMLDNGDHNGGTVSNPQSFSASQYQNSSGGWQNISWTLGRPCDANSYPASWTCNVSTVTSNVFYEQDLRAP